MKHVKVACCIPPLPESHVNRFGRNSIDKQVKVADNAGAWPRGTPIGKDIAE